MPTRRLDPTVEPFRPCSIISPTDLAVSGRMSCQSLKLRLPRHWIERACSSMVILHFKGRSFNKSNTACCLLLTTHVTHPVIRLYGAILEFPSYSPAGTNDHFLRFRGLTFEPGPGFAIQRRLPQTASPFPPSTRASQANRPPWTLHLRRGFIQRRAGCLRIL